MLLEFFTLLTLRFQFYHDLHNSENLSAAKNHLNYLKENILKCFFKEYNRLLFLFQKVN